MPEGDTIFRAARALQQMLAGKTVLAAVTSVAGVDAASLIGRKILGVSAQGKNLLMRFDDGQLLHTHMRMTGSWHIYPPTARWKKPSTRARLILEVEDAVAVCFSAPVVELRRRGDVPQQVQTLGPDILAPTFALTEALRRLRQRDDLPLGEAVMQQHLVAGIGNVYKAEVLFAQRANPFAAVAAYPDDRLESILNEARTLMQANLTTWRRTFRIAGDGNRVWVYRRRGQPCFRCGTLIEMRRQGNAARSTYYCPGCQSLPRA